MRKVIILLVLLTISSVEIFSQTYYYKYLFSVTTNGVKTRVESLQQREVYMTFTNNNSVLAPFTNSDGTSSSAVYSVFISQNDGILSYSELQADTYYDMGAAYMMNANLSQDVYKKDKIRYFHFKSDYSRLNIEMQSGLVHVFEKQSSPYERQAPSQFY